jgi:LmbE family N-acetylglucosaminyl deacetylase
MRCSQVSRTRPARRVHQPGWKSSVRRAPSASENTFVQRGPANDPATQQAIAKRLVEIIDQTKPDVIVTWGPDGLTGHPGHILVNNVVTRVLQHQRVLTHKPRKLYYIAYPESRFPDRGLQFGLSEALDSVSDVFITTKVDGSHYLKQAREAIACHTIAQGGFESNKQWQQAWAHHIEETLGGTVFLRLGLPSAKGRETDIFAGL